MGRQRPQRRSGAGAVKGQRRLVSVGRTKFGFLPPQIPLISTAGHRIFDAGDWKRLAIAKPAMAWRGDGGDGAGAAMGRQKSADGATEVWCRRDEGRSPIGFGRAKEGDVQ
ncbi:hypothetical protein TIFTF001_028703 [Ficus carica]|uniref:Uncharacterized protein n=1 Tax=Ficus carica TaxID=3494 RepID=A0AA88IWY1_FICCA|nr:hypothetical protein TIFTF001_028703 [Ficus carica]